MLRSTFLLLCCAFFGASTGSAFTDSLRLAADRLGERLVRGGHTTVAVIGVDQEAPSALTAEIASELTFHLVNHQGRISVVERSQLEVLLREHQLNATGMTSSTNALQLGELACASAIITVNVQPKVKRRVLVEFKLLNTSSGSLEGMERILVDVPPGFDRPDHSNAPNEKDTKSNVDPLRGGVYIGGGIGESYGGLHPFGQFDLITRGDRLAIGLRLRFMPQADNGLPGAVELGRLHTSGPVVDPISGAFVPSAVIDGAGDALHLVAANDPTFGALAVLTELDKGNLQAQWEQIRPIEFTAERWSLSAPVRLYWGPRTDHRRPIFHTEFSIGADLHAFKASYVVNRIRGTNGPEGIEFQVDRYTTEGPFNDRTSNVALFWNAGFGIGVEWGRLGLSLSGQRSLHRSITDTYTDPFTAAATNSKVVQGDPVAIALLHGSGLDDPSILGSIARDGSVPIGAIDVTELDKRFSTMENLLDRWQWNASLAIRLF